MSSNPITPYEWEDSVCGKVTAFLPQDAPTPKGKHVVAVSYHDSNMCHNIVTDTSFTGFLRFLNKTLADCHSKKQATFETATCCYERSSSRTYVEQILDLRITLTFLGAPIQLLSHVLGDNKSFVDSIMSPHGKIHKRHVVLSFHRVRGSTAAAIVTCQFIDGKCNPADVSRKHWAQNDI